MVAPVEIGEDGVNLLVGNGLLKQQQVGDRHAVGEACLLALEQWATGRGPVPMAHGLGCQGVRIYCSLTHFAVWASRYMIADVRGLIIHN